jgi:hypothetical protein
MRDVPKSPFPITTVPISFTGFRNVEKAKTVSRILDVYPGSKNVESRVTYKK